jgi:two-component system chemotaxis response regulator CheY
MKILIVDDSKMLRDMLVYSLNEGGYENITEAIDGIDGLEQAKNIQYDLLIVDYNMPNMNGIDMIKEVKKLSNYKNIPIFMLTTESSESLKQEAKQSGATGWITKPFVPDQLLKAVNTVLKNIKKV